MKEECCIHKVVADFLPERIGRFAGGLGETKQHHGIIALKFGFGYIYRYVIFVYMQLIQHGNGTGGNTFYMRNNTHDLYLGEQK